MVIHNLFFTYIFFVLGIHHFQRLTSVEILLIIHIELSLAIVLFVFQKEGPRLDGTVSFLAQPWTSHFSNAHIFILIYNEVL